MFWSVGKAFLVVDEMPNSCWECKLVVTTGENAAFCPDDYFCFLHGDKDSVKENEFERANFCPLRSMPEIEPVRHGKWEYADSPLKNE